MKSSLKTEMKHYKTEKLSIPPSNEKIEIENKAEDELKAMFLGIVKPVKLTSRPKRGLKHTSKDTRIFEGSLQAVNAPLSSQIGTCVWSIASPVQILKKIAILHQPLSIQYISHICWFYKRAASIRVAQNKKWLETHFF